MAFYGIEINTWGGCNSGITQELLAKGKTVVGKMTDVGPYVEGPVRWSDLPVLTQ
jgi:hypothetical protein